MTDRVALPLRVGAHTLGTLRRRLVRVRVTLEEGLEGDAPLLPPLPADAHGYFLHALPADRLAEVCGSHARLKPFVRQRYRRSYAALDGSFDDYLGGFSARTRSTLKRKLRKFADQDGGRLDVRAYASPEEVAEFHGHARAISVMTYQERLLAAGLPDGESALAEMASLAARDAVRCWLLFLGGEPVSYLYAPAEGRTLVYAYLGYDPAFAALSPGTVLQLEAMRGLMEEGRFALFDFTEGDGQHKRQFATGAIACVDLLLLRPTLANRLTGHALNGFDATVALAKRVVLGLGLERLARAVRH